MTKFFEKLKLANTAFIFITFCGVAFVLLFQLGSAVANAFRPTGIQVTTAPEEGDTQPVSLTSSRPRLVRGYYYFDIGSPRIAKGSSTAYSPKSLYSPFREENTINIFVVKSGESEGKVLFPRNSLILHSHYVDDDLAEGVKLSRNVFLVVKDDTNSNGFLDDEDLRTVFVSDYDGSNLREVMTGALSVTFPDSDLVLIKKADETVTAFFELNLSNGKLIELFNSSQLKIDAS